MKSLHIRIEDEPLSEVRRHCVFSVRSYFGVGRIVYTEEALTIGEEIREHFTIKDPWDITSLRGRVTLSDWIRCWVLSRNPGEYVYCDTDVEVVYPVIPVLPSITKPALLWRKDIGGSDYAVMFCQNEAASRWLLDILQQYCATPDILAMLMARKDCPPIHGFTHHCFPTNNEQRWWRT